MSEAGPMRVSAGLAPTEEGEGVPSRVEPRLGTHRKERRPPGLLEMQNLV